MNDTVSVNIEKTTYGRLVSMQGINLSLGIIEFGSVDKYLDDIINVLIEDHNEINKYIERYMKGAKGKCIFKSIFGHSIIANHHFDENNKCIKCGIQAPITVERKDNQTNMRIGFEFK